MTTEPGRAEVNGWRVRTGATASEAVDKYWPGAEGKLRVTLLNRVRKWAQLDRETGGPAPSRSQDPQPAANRAPPPTDASTVEGPPRPPPDYDRAGLERVAFLEWHLAELLADLAWVRAAGMVGRIGQLASQVSEVRRDLDVARGQGKPVELDRNPAAVTEEVERRDKRIRHLAAAAQAAKERDL